ncbi:hypothetical protein PUR26_13675, partial [Streptomyces sp. SP18CS02]|nr:hypothetical protein [Streptomyces sp. SP18CS02]
MSGLSTAPAPAALPPHTGRSSFPGIRGRIRDAALRAWPALAAYAVVRAVGIAVLALGAGGDDPRLGTLLAGSFDSKYFVYVAEHGYGTPMPGGCSVQGPLCNYAFFPLYPGLIRAGSAVLPLPTGAVAWGIAIVASLIAAWGVFAVADRVIGRRPAIIAVVLWGIAPHAAVESMAYTEPVFTAIAAWALYAVLDRRWLTAAALAVLAGLTRPPGAAVVAAVVLCALY